MNIRTKRDLVVFVAEICSLLPLLYTIIGEAACKDLSNAGNNLIESLDADETIIDPLDR